MFLALQKNEVKQVNWQKKHLALGTEYQQKRNA